MNKTIPYKDTFLTFYNYKEPLKPASTGFGYQGVLLGSIDGDRVQCHLCGDLYRDLTVHIRFTHKDDIEGVHEYKEKFGLAFETALISETERMNRKAASMRQWYSMTDTQRKQMRQKAREAYTKWLARKGKQIQPKQQLETKNKRGTCPDQLLDKVLKCKEELGHTPSKEEFIVWCGNSQRFMHLIYKTFGSWTEGVKRAGLQPKKQAHAGGRRVYSDEELLDLLQLFHQENGKLPSSSDCKRGFLPDQDIFVRRFGSFPNARVAAGLTARPTRWGEKPV